MSKFVFRVNDLTCPQCAKKVEDALRRHENVSSAKVSAVTGKINVESKGDLDIKADLEGIIRGFGFRVSG